MVDFYGSGAWDNLNVYVDPTGTEEVCDDEDDDEDEWDCSYGGRTAATPLALLLLAFGALGIRRRRA